MKHYLFLFFMLMSYTSFSQDDKIELHFNLQYENRALDLKEYYALNIKDSLQIETLRFYVSNIQLLQNESVIHKVSQKHFLVNAEDPISQSIQWKKKISFNQIQFNIGVDSLYNVSGAYGGSLDPSNGMYWTWQSGYINFKLEGSSNLCDTRNNRFQYHIGGYQAPYNSLQTVLLPVKNGNKIEINVEVAKMISKIDLNELSEVMSPNEKAVELSELIATIFSSSNE